MNICSSDYRAWKVLPKTWKVTAQIVKYNLKNVFNSNNLLPLKTFLWTRRVQFWQTSQKKFKWSPKKYGINPIKKPRNQCSSEYRAWKDLRKNQINIRLSYEKHLQICFFSKKMLPMKTILWTQRIELWQTCQ